MSTQLHEAFEKAAPRPASEPDYDDLWRRGRRMRRIRFGLTAATTAGLTVIAIFSIQAGVFSNSLFGERAGPASDPAGVAEGRVFFAAIDPETAAPIIGFTDPGNGDVHSAEISDFGPGDARTPLLVSGQHLVYYGPGGAYSVPSDLSRSAQKIGSAAYFAPALVDGRVWLAVRDPSAAEAGFLERAQQVSAADGRVITDVALPPGRFTSLVAETTAGLVFEDESALTVWDPSKEAQVMKVENASILSVQGDFVAWCDTRGCGEEIVVANPALGEEFTLQPPQGHTFTGHSGSALSPDGRYLATTVTNSAGDRGMAIIEVATSAGEVVPALGGGGPTVWSASSGEALVMVDGRLLAYDPRTDRVRVVAVDLTPHAFALTVGTP